jgi:VWFA-related protein
VNLPFHDVSVVRQQIERFLQRDNGRLSRPTSIVFFTDSGATLEKTPSTDGKSLIDYIHQTEPGLRSIRRSQGAYGAAERLQLSLRSLEQLASFEAQQPGRKVVLWLSTGWPLLSGPGVHLSDKDEKQIFNSAVSLSNLMMNSRMTLYSVDPHGTDSAGSPRDFYYQQFIKPLRSPKQAQLGDLGLQVLAVQSGGRAFTASNDLAGEIEQCYRDTNSFYVLTIAKQKGDGPNEFHALDVKADHPKVDVRSRSGYYAQP